MKKRSFTSIYLMLMSCFSLVAWNGNGTADSPYLIQTKEDLSQLAGDIENGQNYSGLYFAMTNDIDLQYEEWTPIGNATTKFQGKFNGNNHVVKNLLINQSSVTEQQGVGLFGFVLQGEIRNVGLRNAQVTIGLANCSAALVGVLQGSTLSNCFVENAIVEINAGASGQHAIVIGRNFNSSINDCYVVNSSLKPIGQTAGLFIGSINSDGAKITNCYVFNCQFIDRESPNLNGAGQPLQGIFCGTANTNHSITFNNCYITSIENFTFTGIKGGSTQFMENSTIVEEESLLKTEEEFAHPYLAWKLNRSGGDAEHSGIWSHNGEYPIFADEDNKAVYQAGVIYNSNLSAEEIYSVSRVPEEFAAIDLREHYDLPSYSLLEDILSKGSANKLIYLPAGATDVPVNWSNVIKGAKGEGSGELKLIDEVPFRCPESFYAETASYERECYTDGGWETIILPFNVLGIQSSTDHSDMTARFSVEKYSDQNISGESFIKFSFIDINKGEFLGDIPYLIKYGIDGDVVPEDKLKCIFTGEGHINATDISFSNPFKGTYEILDAVDLWLLSEDGTFFGRGGSEATLYPFRAYLDLSQSDSPAPQYSVMHDNSGTTSIKESDYSCNMYVNNGTIFIHTDIIKNIIIYTPGGYQVRQVALQPGLNEIKGLPAGMYLINKQKVVIL